MILSYNLVKQSWVKEETKDTPRVIDSNDLVELRMKEFKVIPEKKETPVADPDSQFVEGIAAEQVEIPAEPDPEEVLAEAREEAQKIIEEAKKNAQEIEEEAVAKSHELFEEQKALGYEAGMSDAEKSISASKEQLEAELKQQIAQNDEDYRKRLSELEPDLVDAIIAVFDHVFRIQFGEKREILLSLVNNTISHLEAGKHFRIHTSPGNASFLEYHLNEIQQTAGYDAVIELINDDNLQPGVCRIETDFGMFDCSLDTELKNLYKDIRSLCS
jgi:flagellar assembly protein FliH